MDVLINVTTLTSPTQFSQNSDANAPPLPPSSTLFIIEHCRAGVTQW
jgi:hypothetical protein